MYENPYEQSIIPKHLNDSALFKIIITTNTINNQYEFVQFQIYQMFTSIDKLSKNTTNAQQVSYNLHNLVA